jgi:uncharacterized membrane protein YqgA involved in biofilm formation
MIATVINAVFVLAGSILGLLLKNKISEKYAKAITAGLGLCVAIIGICSAILTNNILCVIICMVLGVIIGELLKIEDRLDHLGAAIKSRVMRGRESGQFTEGFMTSTLLFCVGSMAITGSMEAGINHSYTILLSKSVIDCVTAVTFAAAMGIGVCFSSVSILIYQGLLTVLFILVGPFLPAAVTNEMSAVGGLLIVAIGINMLGLGKNHLRCGNMLPAVFLPIAYIPLSELIKTLF